MIKHPQSLQLTSFKKTPEAESTRDPIQTSTSPRATPRTIRQIYEQKGESPFQPKPPITSKPKTVSQLLKEKRALAAVFSPELEEILKNSNTQLHLQMIEEQKQLQEIAKQKAQQAIKEQERKEQIAQRAAQQALEAEKRRKAQEEYELEQQRLAEEEARIVREEQERSERDRMIAEGEWLRLQAQREAAEKQKILEQKRIEAEHQARIEQQRLAEQALEELERKRKQTADQIRERREASKTIDSDPRIEEEIGKMRNELMGPDGRIDEAKIAMATAISSYPSIESLDEIPKQSLTEEQQKYYERKEQILTAKLNVAEDTYYDRESFDSSIEEAHYFRVEYDSIKKELERKRRVCAKMLNLPIRKMPRYPTPPSVKTPPPGKLTQKQIDYYIDKDEELRLLDNKRYLTYLTGLAQAQTPEERESYIAEGLRHQEMTEALQKKIERALDSGLGEDLTQVKEKLKAEGREPQTNDYLELQGSIETSPTSEEKEFQPKRVIKKGSPGQVGPSPLQEDMNKHIKQNLVQMGMTAYEPEERKLQDKSKKGKDLETSAPLPLPQRKKIERVNVKPIGENTIPYQYSKEIGRNGGIERPTSTEARESQDSAIQTAKDFFNGEKVNKTGTPVGEPQRELDWDGLDENIQIKSPVNERQSDSEKQRGPRTKTTMQQKKHTFQRNVQNKAWTMPKPPHAKIYKRKVGDPSAKIYSDEGVYGDEKDELWAKGYCTPEREINLFDIVCEKCQGDHLDLYCPFKKSGRPVPPKKPIVVLERQIPEAYNEQEGFRSTNPCWNCQGWHYYRDCPEKEWHGQLERAKEESDELHLKLLINSKGYARLNQLTLKQIETIRKSQKEPLPQNSTKAPFREITSEERRVSELAKKESKGSSEQVQLDQNSVRRWVEEQNILNQGMRYNAEVSIPYDFSKFSNDDSGKGSSDSQKKGEK